MDSQELFGFNEDGYNQFSEICEVGYLTRDFHWGGHSFIIKTLRLDEELAVGKLIKEYQDTLVEEKAVIIASAAACLVSINGKDFMPYFDKDVYKVLKDRFEYIKNNWFAPVITAINTNYLILLRELYELMEQISNLSQEDQANSNSWSDLLTEQETSEDVET